MNNADTIKEAIKRLYQVKPSEINAATWLKVKAWLFPRIIAYIDGFREEEKINSAPQEKTEEELKDMADEAFGK